MRQKPVYYTIKDRNRDPSEHPVTHQRQRASALGLVLYHIPALLVQAGFTTVMIILDVSYKSHGSSVNRRHVTQERSARDGSFVTDVAESMR